MSAFTPGSPDPGLAGLAGGPAFQDAQTDGYGSDDVFAERDSTASSAQGADSATLSTLQDLQGLAAQGERAAAEDPEQLERMDPLTVRPRTSSWIVCLVLGICFLLAAAGVWWLGVRTLAGQQYDDEVYRNFAGYIGRAPLLQSVLGIFRVNGLTIALCCAIGLLSYVIAALRKRWWLLAQVVAYSAVAYLAGRLLKSFLPRPYLINTESMRGNSAPSGHTILAATVTLALVCVVPRVWRALCAALGFAFTLAVGCSVIDGRWHRPTDVIMSILIAGGLALIMMACTRASGMDAPGTRVSSASVQIVSTVMLTAGVLGALYGGYLVWQMVSGFELGARWTFYGAYSSALAFIASAAALAFGSVLAMRQVTASPLSKIGLLGAPPTPPEKR
ncbi:phosphatase PAP2 family protein [Bifidobacterium actinocoloniiforme]|uniref:phosphatase PAP2 family protein n=1 Tax=Bifidobacterium actinocoloniiforme TaxID=638619 RepID=UPI0009DE6504|nr:phosphatase PAP2 family protein [Bifidobacterium actinocoloniiforme]